MSKYDSLWTHVAQCPEERLTLIFQQIGEICGVPVDHSFLRYKEDLTAYDWQVKKSPSRSRPYCLSGRLSDEKRGKQ